MAQANVAPRHYHINNAVERSFSEAATSYLDHGGEGRYLAPIIDYFADTPLRAIYPFDMQKMAQALYPFQSNATRNRQAITPARAVLSHAYDRGWCDLIRVRRFREEKPARPKAASPVWLHAFARQCDRDDLPHLGACVMFMATTGARISETIALRWPEVDLSARTATLLKTKTSTNSQRHLTDDVAERLRKLASEQDRYDRVFRYTNRHSVNERIKAVCERADLPYKAPHTCGRRTFATRAIELGMDIRTAMSAGDWKSSSVFLEVYVQTRANAGRMVADRFALDDFGGL